MKRVLTTSLLLVCAIAMMAQTDSVRVRLETSQGAEIGIDGDISSTNILTKKVPVGQHVVTVTYGSSFRKDYDIQVTPTNHEFTFSVDGKLTISSVPANARVYVDGMERGNTPLTLDLVGEHNLRVEGDRISYYDYTSHVALKPFEEMVTDVTLKKRPPRMYGMFLANYEPIADSHAVGFTLAFVRRWGVYLRFMTGLDGGDTDFSDIKSWDGSYREGPGLYSNPKIGFSSVNAGLMFRLGKNIYAYAGSGYGTYAKELETDDGTNSIVPYGSKGVMADAGVILKWKALIGQFGYNRIFGESIPNKFGCIYVGVGFTIHKQRKDK